MLISCTSCNSKYLVNSADLKPIGRTVECANCGNQWYQEIILEEKLEINEISEKNTENKFLIKESKNFKEQNIKQTPNLPSTIVKEQKVSVLNSFLVIFFIIILIGSFLIIRNLDLNNLVLFKFYYNEFIFNLKLISNDIAKVIYQLINFIKAILE